MLLVCVDLHFKMNRTQVDGGEDEFTCGLPSSSIQRLPDCWLSPSSLPMNCDCGWPLVTTRSKETSRGTTHILNRIIFEWSSLPKSHRWGRERKTLSDHTRWKPIAANKWQTGGPPRKKMNVFVVVFSVSVSDVQTCRSAELVSNWTALWSTRWKTFGNDPLGVSVCVASASPNRVTIRCFHVLYFFQSSPRVIWREEPPPLLYSFLISDLNLIQRWPNRKVMCKNSTILNCTERANINVLRSLFYLLGRTPGEYVFPVLSSCGFSSSWSYRLHRSVKTARNFFPIVCLADHFDDLWATQRILFLRWW